jgi:methylation protein EvaC
LRSLLDLRRSGAAALLHLPAAKRRGGLLRPCLVCRSLTETVMSFGRMPLANGFLSPEDFGSEIFFDLNVCFCPSCTMVQLADPVAPQRLFHDSYPFFTSSSTRMSQHFRSLAEDVRYRIASEKDPLVVEIGSNDGTLLANFGAFGIRHLGIDPSLNVADAARANGVSTIADFFSPLLAADITRKYGQANAILAANCFCHIADLRSLAEGIEVLLKPNGILIFEDPYLGDIIRLNSYDQIYDEHVYYFTLRSVSAWLDLCGFEVIDVRRQPVHGGSMRYFIARKGVYGVETSVAALRTEETQSGLGKFEIYKQFRQRVDRSREALGELLESLRISGKRVVGYGATSKSTTVLNSCGVTSEHIEFVVDTTPLKQGKYTPGSHIPVRSPSEFHSDPPEYALLLAWNHAEEIMAKEQAFRAAGGKWILYIPEVALAQDAGTCLSRPISGAPEIRGSA